MSELLVTEFKLFLAKFTYFSFHPLNLGHIFAAFKTLMLQSSLLQLLHTLHWI